MSEAIANYRTQPDWELELFAAEGVTFGVQAGSSGPSGQRAEGCLSMGLCGRAQRTQRQGYSVSPGSSLGIKRPSLL